MKTDTTTIRPGRYRHYKGNFYEVMGTARHSETEELLVIYRCLYGDHSMWARPLGMFLEKVLLDGLLVQRFEWAGDQQNILSPSGPKTPPHSPRTQAP